MQFVNTACTHINEHNSMHLYTIIILDLDLEGQC